MTTHLGMKALVRGSGAALLLSNASVAFGQAVPPDPAPAPASDTAKQPGTGNNNGIADIVVTARRVRENLQKVPISVSAFSQQKLKETNVNTIGDLQTFVPSLSFFGGTNGGTVTIRGQGWGSLASTPAVQLYFNEVPLPANRYGQSAAGPGLLFDLGDLEVLKGPQGTVFGRNSVGGAILVASQTPRNSFGGYVEGTLGNYADKELDTAVNFALVPDRILVRASFKAAKRDGYVVALGEPGRTSPFDRQNVDYQGWRVASLFKISDDVENVLTYSGIHSRSNGEARELTYVDPNGLAAFFFPSLLDLLQQQKGLGIRTALATDTVLKNVNDTAIFTNVLSITLSNALKLKSVSGYVRQGIDENVDLDGTVVPLIGSVNLVNGPRVNKQYTQEIQLAAHLDRLQFQTGVFYLNAPFNKLDLTRTTVFGGTRVTRAQYGESSYAFYGQGTYDFSNMVNGLSLTAGARWTHDRRKQNSYNLSGTQLCVAPAPGADQNCLLIQRQHSSALSWNLTLQEQLSPKTQMYLAVRHAYRAGGFNSGVLDPALRTFAPETVTDQEVGIKSDFKLGSVPARVNAAVFHQSYKDIQETVSIFDSVQSLQVSATQNAAAATRWGAEVEALLNITQNLQLGANAGWLHFKYDEFGEGVDSQQLEDAKTVSRPPFRYGLNARYEAPVDGRGTSLSASASWNWTDKQGIQTALGVPGSSPSYGLLTLGASLDKIRGGPVGVSFFMTNALNKKYPLVHYSLLAPLNIAVTSYAEPRMFGFRVRYNLGD